MYSLPSGTEILSVDNISVSCLARKQANNFIVVLFCIVLVTVQNNL